MHGLVHEYMKSYVVGKHSQRNYDAILENAGFSSDHFNASSYYNDSEFDSILAAAETELSMSRGEILYELGYHLLSDVLERFIKHLIDPKWKTLDLIEATESRMHSYVHSEFGAFPPGLKTERISDDELIIRVRSHRNMFELAKGFIEAMSKLYGENFKVDMEVDGNECTYKVTRA